MPLLAQNVGLYQAFIGTVHPRVRSVYIDKYRRRLVDKKGKCAEKAVMGGVSRLFAVIVPGLSAIAQGFGGFVVIGGDRRRFYDDWGWVRGHRA